MVVLLDFAENFSFLVQDAVQAFHWDNRQATLHPFVVYKQPESGMGDLECHSFCVISDSTEHSTSAVHCFLRKLFEELRKMPGDLTQVLYFSDDASSQYKNR